MACSDIGAASQRHGPAPSFLVGADVFGCKQGMLIERTRRHFVAGITALPFARALPSRAQGALERLPGLMARFRVPSVSLALISGQRITQSLTIGAEPGTLYQAGSIAKLVTAICILRLSEQAKLTLDAPVNQLLQSWKLPGPRADQVTPRLLLSHRAGTTVPSFPGYDPGARLPTLGQILDGNGPANTEPVRQQWQPGVEFRYSGGGFMVLQKIIEDLTSQSFDEVAAELVLAPAGMAASSFKQPPGANARPASGHDGNGRPLSMRWHLYPELAAAGLWSTGEDVARLALAVTESGLGRGLLDKDSSRAMATPVAGGPAGLGVFIQTPDRGPPYLLYDALTAGFRSFFAVAADGSFGVSMLTDGEGGKGLIADFATTFFREAGQVPLKLDS
jgi:CubicO group peptidase (beta-lactamase class C family)